jgi:hypothetical protein
LFDQALFDAIKALVPYSPNTGVVTRNGDDEFLLTDAASYNPCIEFV